MCFKINSTIYVESKLNNFKYVKMLIICSVIFIKVDLKNKPVFNDKDNRRRQFGNC